MDAGCCGLIDRGRSVTWPCLRNFGDQPAYGPNSSHGLPLMMRVSRCGTDIGGAPDGGLAVHLGPVPRRRAPGWWCAGTGRRPGSRRSPWPPGCRTSAAAAARRRPRRRRRTCALTLRASPVRRLRDLRASSCRRTRGTACATSWPNSAVRAAARRRSRCSCSGQRAEVDVGAVRGRSSRRRARRSRAWPPSAAAGGRTRRGRRCTRWPRTAGCRPARPERVPQVLDVVGAVHEAHVRDRVDEACATSVSTPFSTSVRPELAGDLELLVDRARPWRCRSCRPGLRACSSARTARRGRCPRCSTDRCSPRRRRRAARSAVIDQSGSSSRSRAPSVALMMPAPTRTTSVFEVAVTLESDTGSLALRVRAVVPVPRLSRGHVSSPGSRSGGVRHSYGDWCDGMGDRRPDRLSPAHDRTRCRS